MKGAGDIYVGPKFGSEIVGEICMAVFGGTKNMRGEIDLPELGDVIDDDEVRVEVYNAVDGGWKEVGEVNAGVIQGLVEGAADGGGDEVVD